MSQRSTNLSFMTVIGFIALALTVLSLPSGTGRSEAAAPTTACPVADAGSRAGYGNGQVELACEGSMRSSGTALASR